VFNATVNNILFKSWPLFLMVEEIGESRETIELPHKQLTIFITKKINRVHPVTGGNQTHKHQWC